MALVRPLGPPVQDGLLPEYHGGAINSVPAIVCAAHQVASDFVPLRDPLPAELLEGVRTVVFILADGLGYRLLQRWMDKHPDSAFHQCVQRGVLRRLTTVLPSTTAAALTTFSTGRTPQQHGILAYKMFLREVGMVGNMITFSPSAGGKEFNNTYLNTGSFVSVPSLYQKLKQAEVDSTVCTWRGYKHSALSKMLYRGAELDPYYACHDAFALLREHVDRPSAHRRYVHLYWDEIDVIQHKYGPHSTFSTTALDGLAWCLGHQLLDPSWHRPDTLFLLSADHGHVHSSEAQAVNLRDHGGLMKMLLTPPCGDSRLPYFYPRPDCVADVAEYLDTHFGHCAKRVVSSEALKDGWFGEGKAHPEALSRIGQFILVAEPNWKFSYPWSAEEKDSIGKHGGMDPEEMEVPLLAWRWN